ncbi:MAG: hypothetical protein ABI543_09695 [Ignavibacteria bacterium]
MKSMFVKFLILVFAAASISVTSISAADLSLNGNKDPKKGNVTGDRKRDRIQQKDKDCVPKKDGTGKKNKKNKMNKKKGNGNKKGNGSKSGKGK